MPGEFIDTNIMRRKLGFDVSVIRVVINRLSQRHVNMPAQRFSRCFQLI